MKIYYLIPQYVPNFSKSSRWQTISRGFTMRHPELQLQSVSVLEEACHEVKFLDATAKFVSKEQVFELIKEFKPDMLVIYTTTPSIFDDISYFKWFKEQYPEKMTVAIGPHVTAEWEDTLNLGEGKLDVICIGEYDLILKDLANKMPLTEIMGIAYTLDGKTQINQSRELLDIKALPFPAWHHIDPRDYPDPGKKFPFITIMGCRGCHGVCTFCLMNNVMERKCTRCRTPKQVCDEIEYDLGLFPYIKNVMFEDPNFGSNLEYAYSVCEEIIKRKLNKKLVFSCNLRVDIPKELIIKMRQANFVWTCIGFEFGTNSSLKAVGKHATVEQAREFAEFAHKQGLMMHGCFMFGSPEETKEDCRATIEFAKSLPLDTVQFSGIVVYPGTPIYTWAKEHHYLVPKKWDEWVGPDFKQTSLLNYPQLSNEDINKFIDIGLKEWYSRPSQIFRLGIKGIIHPSELKRLWYGFKSFLKLYKK